MLEEIKTEIKANQGFFWKLAFYSSLFLCLTLNSSRGINIQRKFIDNPCFEKNTRSVFGKIKPKEIIRKDGKEKIIFDNFEIYANQLFGTVLISVNSGQKIDTAEILTGLAYLSQSIKVDEISIISK